MRIFILVGDNIQEIDLESTPAIVVHDPRNMRVVRKEVKTAIRKKAPSYLECIVPSAYNPNSNIPDFVEEVLQIVDKEGPVRRCKSDSAE